MDIMYVVSSLLVPALVAAVSSFLTVGWVYQYRMKPLMDQASLAIKRGMGALGDKSGQVRLERGIEKAVAKDMMTAQVPELELVMGMLSPETRELVESNPEAVMAIAQRLGLFKGRAGEAARSQYDL